MLCKLYLHFFHRPRIYTKNAKRNLEMCLICNIFN